MACIDAKGTQLIRKTTYWYWIHLFYRWPWNRRVNNDITTRKIKAIPLRTYLQKMSKNQATPRWRSFDWPWFQQKYKELCAMHKELKENDCICRSLALMLKYTGSSIELLHHAAVWTWRNSLIAAYRRKYMPKYLPKS
jgi:hypothetical protein